MLSHQLFRYKITKVSIEGLKLRLKIAFLALFALILALLMRRFGRGDLKVQCSAVNISPFICSRESIHLSCEDLLRC